MTSSPAPPPRNFHISCPFCKLTVSCTAQLLGKRVQCPSCGHDFTAPELVIPNSNPIATETVNPNAHTPPHQQRPAGSTADVGSGSAFPQINTQGAARRSPATPRSVNRSRDSTFLVGAAIIAAIGFVIGFAADYIAPERYDRHDLATRFGRAVIFAIVLTACVTIYILPTLIAYIRGHKNAVPIFVINVFSGFFFVPWVGCLAWALSSHVEESRQTVRVIRVNERGETIDL